jgi:endoglucanase
MTTEAQRAVHQRWLMELTALPTAAGHEDRVIDWIETWVKSRRHLKLARDRAGNVIISARSRKRPRKGSAASKPVFITAHLDHPAFVVRSVFDDGTIELEFRGGVHDPYFDDSAVEIFDQRGGVHRATIAALDSAAKPFKIVTARLHQPTDHLAPGDVARWSFSGADADQRIDNGNLYTPACDDLAAVAAALATLDALSKRDGTGHVGVLFTRAEEIGFIGAIAACKLKSVPKTARLLCLENSRSFAESPIGGGPIVRVGDRTSVFSPKLTNRVSDIMAEHAKTDPQFKWQRKLMPGGTCEATAFAAYGYESTCLCLPLGNYHNMTDIDGVLAGKRPAKVGPECISLEDFHGLVQMLVVICTQIDSMKIAPPRQRMEKLLRTHKEIVGL